MSNQATSHVSRTVRDLHTQVKYDIATAAIDDQELIDYISTVLDRLNRVNTTNARAIVSVASPAFVAAQAIWAKVERSNSLKQLAVWVGNVEVGWL